MSALGVAVVSIGGVILMMVLKRSESAYASVAQCGLVAIILLAVLPEIKELLEVVGSIDDSGTFSSLPVKTIFKAFAILTAGSISADICRDNGENAVAGVVELSVRILALSSALPVFFAVIKIAEAFLN